MQILQNLAWTKSGNVRNQIIPKISIGCFRRKMASVKDKNFECLENCKYGLFSWKNFNQVDIFAPGGHFVSLSPF